MTVPVAVCSDKAAEAALERLRALEIEDRARGKVIRPQFHALAKRPGG